MLTQTLFSKQQKLKEKLGSIKKYMMTNEVWLMKRNKCKHTFKDKSKWEEI